MSSRAGHPHAEPGNSQWPADVCCEGADRRGSNWSPRPHTD